ncbi:uncharacterized protein LOC134152580 [Rhea pennata]|uniref:uncharacterized protein LOC134152580 n=1 Tax=Rhea pennata TaxID=8795 RepID=UPI002E269FF3
MGKRSRCSLFSGFAGSRGEENVSGNKKAEQVLCGLFPGMFECLRLGRMGAMSVLIATTERRIGAVQVNGAIITIAGRVPSQKRPEPTGTGATARAPVWRATKANVATEGRSERMRPLSRMTHEERCGGQIPCTEAEYSKTGLDTVTVAWQSAGVIGAGFAGCCGEKSSAGKSLSRYRAGLSEACPGSQGSSSVPGITGLASIVWVPEANAAIEGRPERTRPPSRVPPEDRR